jgi:pyruvate dehydrogenase E2 component (dihydrolipoamide acetyltransferase)
MPIEILMPALSPTMEEGNLVRWLKKEGDVIKSGMVIAEIETDKATMEVEAADDGILGKIVIPEGTDEVKVNSLIALLLEPGESADSLTSFSSAPSPAPSTSTVESSVSTQKEKTVMMKKETTLERVFATPLARRIADNKQIDLSTVTPSGPNGRIVKADVENVKTPVQIADDTSFVDEKLPNMRKVIAKRLSESKQMIPHFYLSLSCKIDALLTIRSEINSARDEKISVNDFVIKALAKALHDVPEANVMWNETSVRKFNSVDISVAVAIDGGLVTPIVRSAHRKSLGDISTEMKALIVKAREGKLKPEEFQGGTFSLSNLGMFGIEDFNAIINPPQSGILAVGAGKQEAIVENGQLTIGTMMKLTLSVDHRVVDGAVGANLLQKIQDYLEHPVTMLV